MKENEYRRMIADATIDLIAETGGMAATIENAARRSGLAMPTVTTIFPTREEWLRYCFERLCERRLAHARQINDNLKGQVRTARMAVEAVLRTTLDGTRIEPLYAAAMGIYFLSRYDSRLSDQISAIWIKGESEYFDVLGQFFPLGVPEAVVRFINNHCEGIGCWSMSNGFGEMDVLSTDIPKLERIVSSAMTIAHSDHAADDRSSRRASPR